MITSVTFICKSIEEMPLSGQYTCVQHYMYVRCIVRVICTEYSYCGVVSFAFFIHHCS